MSNFDLDHAWKQDLPPGEKLVLVCLADHKNSITRRCDPTIETIADETGYSIPQVERHIRSLKRRGLIIATKKRDGTKWPRNHYRFEWPKSEEPITHDGKLTHHPCGTNQKHQPEGKKDEKINGESPVNPKTEVSIKNPGDDPVALWHQTMRKHGYESEGTLPGDQHQALMQFGELDDLPDFLGFCIGEWPFKSPPNPAEIWKQLPAFVQHYEDAA